MQVGFSFHLENSMLSISQNKRVIGTRFLVVGFFKFDYNSKFELNQFTMYYQNNRLKHGIMNEHSFIL